MNWPEVYKEAEKQNVIPITWDSIRKLQETGQFEVGENEQMQMLVMRWYGMSNLQLGRYQEYYIAVRRLSKFLSDQGLKPMIMKGYGCSLNYPKPDRRPCGDIDIYVMDENGHHDIYVAKHVDNLRFDTFKAGINVDNEHHSTFHFCDFMVENHYTVLDVNVHKSSKRLDPLLESLASTSIDEGIVKDGVLLPPVRFNSIHLLRHMAIDFATVSTSLRHVLDWATFVDHCFKTPKEVHSSSFDWEFVRDVASKANMNRFLDAINGICVEYLGYPKEMFPVEKNDKKLRDRVLDDILNNEDKDDRPNGKLSFTEKIRYGIHKTSRLWKNRWKCQIVFDECLLMSFLTLASNRLKN